MQSAELSEIYESHMKWVRDVNSMREEGWEEGLRIGREEGLRSAARNLLATGLSIEQVSQRTGLSTDEVARIEKDMR